MEERKNIFGYLSQILGTFGGVTLCMAAFTFLFGSQAEEISALYLLGSRGIALETLMEFLGLSVIVVVLRTIFFTDVCIKGMSMFRRAACTVTGIFIVMVLFVIIFGWFPVNMWQPWAMFLLCFGFCLSLSVAISVKKAKLEDKKLMQGLEKMKQQWEEENERADHNERNQKKVR